MAQKLKFPTLITAPLDTHHLRYEQMVEDVQNSIDNYNNRPAGEKLRIPFRGKSKVKVIKNVNTAIYNIGQRQCIQLCVEEYKEGNDDLYFKRGNNQEIQLIPTDKLGSSQNYALLYPLKEDRNGQTENRWLIIIYDTPNKDDSDIINTIKYTVNKILEFPFRFVIPELLNGVRNVPKVEITYLKTENERGQHIRLQRHLLRSTLKTTRKIEYVNVPAEDVNGILAADDVEANTKKTVKFFFDLLNRSSYQTVTQERQDDGNITSEVVSRYSYEIDVDEQVMNTLFDVDAMRSRFANVITNYLTNGHNPANNN